MSALAQRALALARQPGMQRALRLGVLGLVVVLVARALWQNWRAVADAHWHISFWLLALGFGLLLVQELSYGIIWRLTLQRLGYRLPLVESLRIYLTAEFVRYIPGNVWHVLARIRLAEERNIPRSQGFASMTIELATKIAAGFLIFVAALPFWGNLGRLGGAVGHLAPLVVALIGLPLLIAGLQPRVLTLGLNWLARLLKRGPITIALTYRDILTVTGAWLVSWSLAGLGCWLALAAIGVGTLTPASLPLMIGINALGWVIGFLSFITPSGLGFREGTVALLLALAGVVPDLAVGGIVAIFVARLLPTLAEVLCVGAAYGAARLMTANRPTGAEQPSFSVGEPTTRVVAQPNRSSGESRIG